MAIRIPPYQTSSYTTVFTMVFIIIIITLFFFLSFFFYLERDDGAIHVSNQTPHIKQTVTFTCAYTGHLDWLFSKSTSTKYVEVINVQDETTKSWKKKIDSMSAGFYYCIGQKPNDKKYYMSQVFVDVVGKYINLLKL